MLRKFWYWTRFVLKLCSILVGLVFIKGEISRESAAMCKNTSCNTHRDLGKFFRKKKVKISDFSLEFVVKTYSRLEFI
jgi:hypothetical protein